MKATLFVVLLLVAAGLVVCSWAADPKVPMVGNYGVVHGGNSEHSATATRDTLVLIGPWGSGAVFNGQFEDPDGEPAWNGWIALDQTQDSEDIWHVDSYNVVSGNYSAWCGEITYDACSELDMDGGYGPGYEEWLSWYGTVANPALATEVTVAATVNHNTEPGYDYSELGFWTDSISSLQILWSADGVGEQVGVVRSVTYSPDDYIGQNDDQIRITWQVTSDGGWDDSDCSYFGNGALQVDDITVTMIHDGQTTNYFHDFEDGTLGEWTVEFPTGVGDYAHIRDRLPDLDPCAFNNSPVVCFIADDIMHNERGLPTQSCQSWCYGPGGYIVTTRGGAAGPAYHIHNSIYSPVIPWPESAAGDFVAARFEFDVYRHEPLLPASPGIFYIWSVNSTVDSDPGQIITGTWQDRSFVYYGGPEWLRHNFNISDLIVRDRKFIQVELAVYKIGYVWGWVQNDGTPAPYFDNVRVSIFEQHGPAMVGRELDLAQDAFPADGQVHAGEEMHLNDVRFDMAANISPRSHMRNDPGDSIVVSIGAVRTGSELVTYTVVPTITAPRLYFEVKTNAAFPPSMRLPVGPFTTNAGQYGELHGEISSISQDQISGWVKGAPAMSGGIPSSDRWMFDLPDQDFLYPGDELHYYIEAWDFVGTDYQRATLPADLTGFGTFSNGNDTYLLSHYDIRFVVHALPSVFDDGGDHPRVLFWYDAADPSGVNEWRGALSNLYFYHHDDYDVFYTNSASSGVGNGLGGRALLDQIEDYEAILYTAGDLGRFTITSLDYDGDPGDDVGLLTDWLQHDQRHLLATGDNLVTDMDQSSAQTSAFVTDWLGVVLLTSDARPLLGGDMAPIVVPIAGSLFYPLIPQWIAYGGCEGINTFDGVVATDAETLAEFNDGGSGLSAASRFVASNGSQVISMPYDFSDIWTPRDPGKAKLPYSFATRDLVLNQILTAFGVTGLPWGPVPSSTPAARFTAGAYPNPFNPITRIDYHLPKAGHLEVKIYNVRGELVRKLIDESVNAGPGQVVWDGSTDHGARASSGAYFYEVRSGRDVHVGKIMMIK